MAHDLESIRYYAIEYLSEIRRRKEALEWSREELDGALSGMDALRSANYGCEPAIKVSRDKTHEAYLRLDEARAEYASQIVESCEFLRESRKVCNRERPAGWVCYLHWVDGKQWADIAHEMGYSLSHVKTNLVPAGLAQIYERMPEEFRSELIPNAQPRKSRRY